MRSWMGLAAMLVACGGDDGAKDTGGGEETSVATDTSVAETAVETTVATDTTTEPDEVEPETTVAPTEVTEDSSPEVEAVEEVAEEVSEEVETDTSTGPELAGACPLASRYGGFVIVDDGENGYVQGEIADGVVPVSVLEVVKTEGDCTLYRKNNPFCEPPCSGVDTCDFDGNCIPYPLPQELGNVTVDGLAGGQVVMTFGPSYFATDVPYPPWAADAAITMKTAGGAFEPLTLEGFGPQTFAASDTLWTIDRGTSLTAHWSAPSGAVMTTVELQLLIDQHGNAPASVRCTFADDGEGEVPAGIIDGLLDSGVSGFPSGKLIRQTLDSTAVGDGCAELSVRSPRGVKVKVAGITPCTTNAQCPAGQHCNVPIETCVDN